MRPNNSVFDAYDIPIPRPVRFSILLIFDILSIICSVFVMLHLLTDKTLRKHLVNHLIIILLAMGLLIQLIDIPFHLSFYFTGVVQPLTSSMCLLWWYLDVGIFNGFTIIMAWSTIHRYLLIFHDSLFSSGRKRFLFHYLPLIILFPYIIIFYIVAIVYPPCQHSFHFYLPICGEDLCYLDVTSIGLWDTIMNNLLPTIIIVIASISVLLHVHYQKQRVGQRIQWHRRRKLIIQTLSVSVLYLILSIPLNVSQLVHLFGVPRNEGRKPELLFDFLCYFLIFLYPFVCLGCFSELRKKLSWKKIISINCLQRKPTTTPQ